MVFRLGLLRLEGEDMGRKLEPRLKMSPYDIIIRPIITAKSNRLIHELNKYTFEVHPQATKVDVKRAIEEIYGVKVAKVNIINLPGKTRYYRWRYPYRTGKMKKAIVTLKEGRIDIPGMEIEGEYE